MKKLVLVALLVLSASSVFAQGNDFPGIPISNPGFPQPTPGGFPPYPPSSENGWRTKGPTQRLANVRKGDKVILRQNMWTCEGCYWGFAVGTIMPAVQGMNDLELYYPDGVNNVNQWDHGRAGAWCIQCMWIGTAGDDFPEYALIYWGSDNFWAILELVDIWPAPIPPLWKMFTDPDKQTAGMLASGFNMMSGLWIGASITLGFDWRIAGVFNGLGWGAAIIGSYYNGLRTDPPDYDYCSVTPMFYIEQDIHNDVDWLRSSDYDYADGWLPTSLEEVLSLGRQSQVAIDRAMTAANDGNMDCANARRGEALDGLWYMGYYMHYLNWAINETASRFDKRYDMAVLYDHINEIAEAANFLMGLQ